MSKNIIESVTELIRMPQNERDKIDLFSGHMPFGLHKYFNRDCNYITILRNPVDRVISHYYYVLRTPHHYLYDEVTSSGMSLKDYVSSKISTELHNGQVRLLSGVEEPGKSTPYMPLPDNALDVALKNLKEKFILAGVMERFDESLLAFAKILGWKKSYYKYYKKFNVSQNKSIKEDVDPETLRIIRKNNEIDIELYNIALRMFEDKCRELNITSRDVAALRLKNKMYKRYLNERNSGRGKLGSIAMSTLPFRKQQR